MKEPRITSCISTFEGDDTILDVLYSLACQSADPETHETLVIARGPGAFAQQREAIERMLEQGHSVGMTFKADACWETLWDCALETSRATHLHFIDADTIAGPRLIECLLDEIDARSPDLQLGHLLPRFATLPPPEIDLDHWGLWGLRHYGSEPRDAAAPEAIPANNFCASRSLLEKRILYVSDAGRLAGWQKGPPVRVVPDAFAFKQVDPALYEEAEILHRIREADSLPFVLDASGGLIGAICDELRRAVRRAWFRIELATLARQR